MPQWESPADIKAEREIISVVTDKWKCEARKTSPKYGFDFSLLRGNLIGAIAEVRDRKATLDYFAQRGGLLFSVHKIERCLAFSELTDVPAFLVVRCGGTSIYYTKFERQDRKLWTLEFFDGNIPSRHENDREPVFVIPASQFSHISANANPAS